MTNACSPSALPGQAFFAALAADPCAAAVALQAAQLQLLTGANVASVRFGDQETRFSRVDANALQKAINRLTAMCDAAHGRARTVRAGPHARWTAPRNGWRLGGW
jgi:hypothetical protein